MAVKVYPDMIITDLQSCSGSDESTRVYMISHIKDGNTEVIVEHKIREIFSLNDYEKAIDMYERLTCASGRRQWQLKDLAHHYNPKK